MKVGLIFGDDKTALKAVLGTLSMTESSSTQEYCAEKLMFCPVMSAAFKK